MISSYTSCTFARSFYATAQFSDRYRTYSYEQDQYSNYFYNYYCMRRMNITALKPQRLANFRRAYRITIRIIFIYKPTHRLCMNFELIHHNKNEFDSTSSNAIYQSTNSSLSLLTRGLDISRSSTPQTDNCSLTLQGMLHVTANYVRHSYEKVYRIRAHSLTQTTIYDNN